MDLSSAWWLSSICVGSVGTGLFVYGKKQTRLPQLLVGMALVAESAFVSSWAWMLAIAALLVIGLWAVLRVA